MLLYIVVFVWTGSIALTALVTYWIMRSKTSRKELSLSRLMHENEHLKSIALGELLRAIKAISEANNGLRLQERIIADDDWGYSVNLFESSIARANRIVSDINTIDDIRKGSLALEDNAFDIVALVKENSEAFREHWGRIRPDVTIKFLGLKKAMVLADRAQVSRCFCAMLSQTLKQTTKGVIHVRVDNDPPIFKAKWDYTITVSGAMAGVNPDRLACYFDPTRYREIGLLSPESMLRLFIGKAVAERLLGKMSCEAQSGRLAFVFRFQAAPIAQAATEEQEEPPLVAEETR